MSKIWLSSQAHIDLVEIGLYIAKDSFSAADKQLRLIEKTLRTLARSPAMGRQREELATGLRSYPVSSYVMAPDGIQIARILHGRRDVKAQISE